MFISSDPEFTIIQATTPEQFAECMTVRMKGLSCPLCRYRSAERLAELTAVVLPPFVPVRLLSCFVRACATVFVEEQKYDASVEQDE